jgi:hypothetical protein
MTTNRAALLIAIGFFLQNFNAGFSSIVHNPMVTVLVASTVGAYQIYVHYLGIQTDPNTLGKEKKQ